MTDTPDIRPAVQVDETAEHQWVAMAGFAITEREIRANMAGGPPLILNLEALVLGPELGCSRCEAGWEAADDPCPGQPPGRLEYVEDDADEQGSLGLEG